jgi:hypothetical protein
MDKPIIAEWTEKPWNPITGAKKYLRVAQIVMLIPGHLA